MLQVKLPKNASILITNACNYNCSYCYTDANNISFDELTTTQWKSVMDEMGRIGIFELHIDGGESFDRSDVFDLLSYATFDKKFVTSIATNASLLNENNVAQIDDSVQILVRVDGLEKSHEFVRGINSYKPTIRGLDLLLRHGKKVIVKTVVNRFNQYDLENLHNFLLEKNISQWQISRILPFGRALDVWDQLSITDDQWNEIVSKLEDLHRKNATLELKIEKFYDELNNQNTSIDKTFERGRGIYISPNGDVTSTRHSLIMGKSIDNVLKKDLHKILEENSELFVRNLQISNLSLSSVKIDFSGIY